MIDLKDYGYLGSTHETHLIPARVTEVRRGSYAVMCEHGGVRAKPKARSFTPQQSGRICPQWATLC